MYKINYKNELKRSRVTTNYHYCKVIRNIKFQSQYWINKQFNK